VVLEPVRDTTAGEGIQRPVGAGVLEPSVAMDTEGKATVVSTASPGNIEHKHSSPPVR
jgi:hypothetical protein